MPIIERRNGYVYVEYAKPFNFEKFITISKQVVKICVAEHYQKLLVNISQMTGKVKPLERFEIGVQGALIFRNKVKIAMLYRAEEIDRFAETVSVNRGLSARIFSEMDQAMEWLEVEEVESNQ